MHRITAKVLTVLLILQVFIGQAMAYVVVPCQMMHEPVMDTPSDQMTMMAHSSMLMNESKTSASHASSADASTDCCEQDNSCSMEQCHTGFYLPSTISILHHSIVAEKIKLPLFSAQSQAPTSLFRPPIFS